MSTEKKGNLKKPCKDCPFILKNEYLRPGRKLEIANSLLNGASFPCHKTLDYSGGDGEGEMTDATRFCTGALLAMDGYYGEKGGFMMNQAARFEARLGYISEDINSDEELVDLYDWLSHEGDESGENGEYLWGDEL